MRGEQRAGEPGGDGGEDGQPKRDTQLLGGVQQAGGEPGLVRRDAGVGGGGDGDQDGAGAIMAAPAPCPSRAPTSMPALAASEHAANSAVPATSNGRRPNRSPVILGMEWTVSRKADEDWGPSANRPDPASGPDPSAGELAKYSGRLPCMIAGGAGRPARHALLRSVRVITWPLWRLGVAWMRRDPQLAEYVHDGVATRYSHDLGPYHLATLCAQADHAVAVSKMGELQQAEAELTEVITRLDPLADGDAQLLLDARRWHHRVLVQMGWVSETEADARFVAESYAPPAGPRPPLHAALAAHDRRGTVGGRPPR